MKEGAKQLLEHVIARHPAMFAALPVQTLGQSLLAADRQQPYNHIPATVSNTWQQIEQQYGQQALRLHQWATQISLILNFDPNAGVVEYTDAVLEQFALSFQRIQRRISTRLEQNDLQFDDSDLKDFAVCSHRLFPAGARLVEPMSSVQRSLLAAADWQQGLRFLRCMIACGGHQPFFRVHTHPKELNEFNPPGWQACCERITDMLRLNPGIRGMVGGSWFYDPQLSRVSPHLEYVRALITENGGFCFFAQNEASDSDALKTSATRRKAYEDGHFQPRTYVVLWPRSAMLQWQQTLPAKR